MEIQGYPNYLIYAGTQEEPVGKVWSHKTGRFLKLKPHKDQYFRIGLWDENKQSQNITIHRLIGLNYIDNDDPLKYMIDHINRNKQDNRLENLRWVTPTENQLNKTINKNKTIPFKWIYLHSKKYYGFERKYCKKKSSKDLSKILCYSFFYLLKYPEA